jgi:solute carrier family 50 protein (sugar transporter)
MVITDILGGLGNAFAIIFFIMPVTLIIEVVRTKSTHKVPYFLFVFTILNCEFWTIYGAKKDAWPLIVCNVIGIVTNHIYLTIFFKYLNVELMRKIFFIVLLYSSFAVSFALLFFLVPDPEIYGVIAMLMNICMFVSPLQNLNKVITLQDNTYIPLPISVTLIFNCTVWTLYGFFKDKDLYVMIPNMLGLALAILQVVLWVIYRKPNSYTKNSDEDELEQREKDDIIKSV